MPSPFYEISKRFGLRRLLGTSNVHDIGTGFQALGADIDNINHGHQDFLQAGVVGEADWSFTANIVSGTGELGSTGTTGGKAWLPDPVLSGALMRTVTGLAKLEKLKPGSLPSSGKYMSVAFEIAPAAEDGWDNAVTVAAHSGTEKNTEAEAIAAPPATTAGKIQVREVIIKNTAGVYSIVAQRDRRPWARGALAFNIGVSSFPSLRVECSGVPLLITLTVGGSLGSAGSKLVTIKQDGTAIAFAEQALYFGTATTAACMYVLTTPTGGSHLFTATSELTPSIAALTIQETLRPVANNGTS